MKVDELTDEQLLASVKEYAAHEREGPAALERRLETIDARCRGMRQGWSRRIDEEGENGPARHARRSLRSRA